MDAIKATESCYEERLERKIRKTYRTVVDVVSSISGHMLISGVVELAGSFFGNWGATKVSQYSMQTVSGYVQEYPLIFRATVICSLGTCLYGLAEYQGVQASKRLLLIALVGLLAIPGVWDEFHKPCVDLFFTVNQVAASIFIGFIGLVVTGVVPVFWDSKSPFRGYVVRNACLEVAGRTAEAWITAPVGLLYVGIFTVPRFLVCLTIKTAAYHIDALIPFVRKCIQNFGLVKRQMIPNLTRALIQKYAGSQREELVKTLTEKLFKQFNKQVASLFPPFCYHFFGSILPIPGKKMMAAYLEQSVESQVEGKVTDILDYAEKHSDFFAKLTTHSLLLFAQLMQHSPQVDFKHPCYKILHEGGEIRTLYELHKRWQSAMLDRRDNDEGRARIALTKGLEVALRMKNPASYAAWSVKVQKWLDLSAITSMITESIPEMMQTLQAVEKEFFGVVLTRPIHMRYWEEFCKIYIPFFVIHAISNYDDLQASITPSQEREMIDHLQAFLCNGYVEAVVPRNLGVILRKVVGGGSYLLKAVHSNLNWLVSLMETRVEHLSAKAQEQGAKKQEISPDYFDSSSSAPQVPDLLSASTSTALQVVRYSPLPRLTRSVEPRVDFSATRHFLGNQVYATLHKIAFSQGRPHMVDRTREKFEVVHCDGDKLTTTEREPTERKQTRRMFSQDDLEREIRFYVQQQERQLLPEAVAEALEQIGDFVKRTTRYAGQAPAWLTRCDPTGSVLAEASRPLPVQGPFAREIQRELDANMHRWHFPLEEQVYYTIEQLQVLKDLVAQILPSSQRPSWTNLTQEPASLELRQRPATHLRIEEEPTMARAPVLEELDPCIYPEDDEIGS